MSILEFNNVHLHNGLKDLLKEATFRIEEGQHYGLIGANGTGKTTLIRLIRGKILPDSGKIRRKPGLRIGYLPQQPEFDSRQTIESFLLEDLALVRRKLNTLEAQMTREPENTAIMEKYSRVLEQFEEEGGYRALDEAPSQLNKLGMNNPVDQTMGTLSGGERSLVFFARSVLKRPDLLILDEPGNHLDYLGLAWLEAFLGGYSGTVLIVSHNRYLLDRSCHRLLALNQGHLRNFTGLYSDYKRERLKEMLLEKQAYQAALRKRSELTRRLKELQSIATSQYNPPATVMKQLGVVKARIAEIDRQSKPPEWEEETRLDFDFGEEKSRSRIAIQIKNYDLGFGSLQLLKNASLEIRCGEKAALVGPNGSGKTSLLRTLVQEGNWDHPHLRINPGLSVGYLSQNPEEVFTGSTLLEEIRSWGALGEQQALGLARRFAFRYEDRNKPLGVLSGGEINRLQLARLMYRQCSLIILDEPTNHMDIPSREAIEEAIRNYPGTVLVVSHDRYFLDRLTDCVYSLEDQRLNRYEGNFTNFFRQRYVELPRLDGKLERRGKEKTKNLEQGIDESRLVERISSSEVKKKDLELQLKKALDQGDTTQGRKIAVQLERLEKRIAHDYRTWETLE